MTAKGKRQYGWTPEQIATASSIFTRMRSQKPPAKFVAIDRAVAQAIGKTVDACMSRRHYCGGTYGENPRHKPIGKSTTKTDVKNGHMGAKALVLHADAFAERNRRAAARERQDLSGQFFGDPPPGYSALEGKTGQQ